MKKMLFIALCNINDLSNGVTLKVCAQIEGFKALGYDVVSATYDNDAILINGGHDEIRYESVHRRHDLFNHIKSYVKDHPMDLCFIRYPHLDLMMISVLKTLKTNIHRILIEIPSYPINYPKKSWTVRYFHMMDIINRHRLKKYIDLIFAVGSPVTTIYGIKTITIPNGYMRETQAILPYISEPNEINILSLTSFYDIHGLDRLIEGIKIHQKNDDYKVNVRVHLVGDGPEKEKLVSIVDTYNIQEYVKFYPPMSHDQLKDLYKIINMGCGPLAIHRTQYRYASPLKTKDYFQRGLPFFCAYEEIGVDKNYPYMYTFPLDDTPIDIKKLITFYQSYQPHIQSAMRDIQKYGEERFNWKNILRLGL